MIILDIYVFFFVKEKFVQDLSGIEIVKYYLKINESNDHDMCACKKWVCISALVPSIIK